MKRVIALTLAVMMIASLFCACGEKKKSDSATEAPKDVTTTVEAKYDQGFAEKYAKSVTTDESGNKTYEFDSDAYKSYTHDYNNNVSAKLTNDLVKIHETSYGQFCYINDEKKAVVVGLNPGQYDEAVASKEAAALAKSAFPYFLGLEQPVKTINVIYCNANNQDEVYGSFEFTAE